MNSTFLLLADIRAEIAKAFEQMPFRVEAGKDEPEKYRSPAVCIGHVPPKRSMPTSAGKGEAIESEPPFVLIRSLDGEMKFNGNMASVHEVNVGILCCVFSNESFTEVQAGYHDIMNMMDRVLITLCSKFYWGDGYWSRLQNSPIRWMTGLDKAIDTFSAGAQFHPYYGAAVIGTFTAAALPIPRVAEVDAQEPQRKV